MGAVIALGMLVIVMVVVVALVVVLTSRGRPERPDSGGGRIDGAQRPWQSLETDLTESLGRWEAAGLLSSAQVTAIGDFERSRSPVGPTGGSEAVPGAGPGSATAVPHERTTLAALVEALGYLGGVLAVSGVVLLIVNYWSDLSFGGRLALSGITAVALIVAGLAVPEGRASVMVRLRSFLWTLATVAVAVFTAVCADRWWGDESAVTVVATTATAVALVSAAMWQGRFRPVQQAVTSIAAVVALGTWSNELSGDLLAGLVVWSAGAGLVVVGLRRMSRLPVVEVAVGAIAVPVGAMIAVADDPGIGLLFVVASGATLVTLVLIPRLVSDISSIVVLSVVGGITLTQTLPPFIAVMAQDGAIATGTVMWAVSAGLCLLGVRRLGRVPLLLEILGATGTLVACAVLAAATQTAATLAGLLTAAALLAISLRPGRVAFLPVGAAGLLAFVPWSIAWFFPGEGRVPLLISVSGLLIVAVAVLMARSGRRFGAELGHHPPR